jgi:hypothetical protein
MRPRARRGKPCNGTLGDQLALELRESGEDAEREAAIGGRRINLCTGAGQHLQPDAPGAQIVDRVDQMTQVAPQPIQLPKHQGVAGLDRFQTGNQPRAGIVTTGRKILVDTGGIDAGRQHRILLRRQRLGAVRFGDANIADQHCATKPSPEQRFSMRLSRALSCLIGDLSPICNMLWDF